MSIDVSWQDHKYHKIYDTQDGFLFGLKKMPCPDESPQATIPSQFFFLVIYLVHHDAWWQ